MMNFEVAASTPSASPCRRRRRNRRRRRLCCHIFESPLSNDPHQIRQTLSPNDVRSLSDSFYWWYSTGEPPPTPPSLARSFSTIRMQFASTRPRQSHPLSPPGLRSNSGPKTLNSSPQTSNPKPQLPQRVLFSFCACSLGLVICVLFLTTTAADFPSMPSLSAGEDDSDYAEIQQVRAHPLP